MSPTQQLDTIRTGTDANGRAVPMTKEDALIRGQAIARALDDMGDADEQRETLEELMRGIDEDRLSYRKRFR